jgi:hypothetical protein
MNAIGMESRIAKSNNNYVAEDTAQTPTAKSENNYVAGDTAQARTAKLKNNYVAGSAAPNWGRNKPGAGARPGNRNALKSGAYTAAMKARRRKVWMLTQCARVAISLAKIEAMTRP